MTHFLPRSTADDYLSPEAPGVSMGQSHIFRSENAIMNLNSFVKIILKIIIAWDNLTYEGSLDRANQRALKLAMVLMFHLMKWHSRGKYTLLQQLTQ